MTYFTYRKFLDHVEVSFLFTVWAANLRRTKYFKTSFKKQRWRNWENDTEKKFPLCADNNEGLRMKRCKRLLDKTPNEELYLEDFFIYLMRSQLFFYGLFFESKTSIWCLFIFLYFYDHRSVWFLQVQGSHKPKKEENKKE